MDLLLVTIYENELEKTNQKEFRIEKGSTIKDDKLNGKAKLIHLPVGLIKKEIAI